MDYFEFIGKMKTRGLILVEKKNNTVSTFPNYSTDEYIEKNFSGESSIEEDVEYLVQWYENLDNQAQLTFRNKILNTLEDIEIVVNIYDKNLSWAKKRITKTSTVVKKTNNSDKSPTLLEVGCFLFFTIGMVVFGSGLSARYYRNQVAEAENNYYKLKYQTEKIIENQQEAQKIMESKLKDLIVETKYCETLKDKPSEPMPWIKCQK